MTLANTAVARVSVRSSGKKVARAAAAKSARAAMLPGGAISSPVTAASWNSSTLPRSIRARTSPRRKAAKPGRVTPPSPASPHQEAAQNATTGRVALGPWSGPFANADPLGRTLSPENPLPDTLYLDTAGSVHYGLSQGAHEAVMRTVRALQDTEAISTTTSTTKLEAVALDRAEVVRGSRVASAYQQPAKPKQRLGGHGMRGHAAVTRMHLINQPRRHY